MHLINGLVAGYLFISCKENPRSLKIKEEQEREQSAFSITTVRNALSSLQYAAHVTSDEKIIETCESAIERIVWALSSVRKQPQRKLPQYA